MGKPITLLRVVVVSPSDVELERKAVREVLDSLNRTSALNHGFNLSFWGWEDAPPSFDPRGAQDVIDRYLRIQDADIVIGIFKWRFGTPTKGCDSGAQYELKQATDASKNVMVYFNKSIPKEGDAKEQLTYVQNFKESFQGLYGEYDNEDSLRARVTEHLTHFIAEQAALVTLPTAAATRYLQDKDTYDHSVEKLKDCSSQIVAVHNWTMPIQPVSQARKDDLIGASIDAYYEALLEKARKTQIEYIRIFQIPKTMRDAKGAPKVMRDIKSAPALREHVKECIKLRDELARTPAANPGRIRVLVCNSLYTATFLLLDEKIAFIHVHRLHEQQQSRFYYFVGTVVIESDKTRPLVGFAHMYKDLNSNLASPRDVTLADIDKLFPGT